MHVCVGLDGFLCLFVHLLIVCLHIVSFFAFKILEGEYMHPKIPKNV